MGDGLRRFLHLERPRPGHRTASGGEEHGIAGGERARFDAVEPAAGQDRPAAASPGRATPAPPAGRSRAPAAASGLELDVADAAEQPFRRCCRCEVESGRYAQTCSGCGADLQTEEQRVFNERLWAERRREAEATEHENAARREAARAAEADAARARRAAAEALAREVGERERRRLEAGGWRDGPPLGHEDPGWSDRGYDPRPWGLRLLGLIRDPRWRAAAIAGALAAIALTVIWALSRRDPRAIVVLAILVSILFSPPRARWRGRWWR